VPPAPAPSGLAGLPQAGAERNAPHGGPPGRRHPAQTAPPPRPRPRGDAAGPPAMRVARAVCVRDVAGPVGGPARAPRGLWRRPAPSPGSPHLGPGRGARRSPRARAPPGRGGWGGRAPPGQRVRPAPATPDAPPCGAPAHRHPAPSRAAPAPPTGRASPDPARAACDPPPWRARGRPGVGARPGPTPEAGPHGRQARPGRGEPPPPGRPPLAMIALAALAAPRARHPHRRRPPLRAAAGRTGDDALGCPPPARPPLRPAPCAPGAAPRARCRCTLAGPSARHRPTSRWPRPADAASAPAAPGGRGAQGAGRLPSPARVARAPRRHASAPPGRRSQQGKRGHHAVTLRAAVSTPGAAVRRLTWAC
jgi:hypothetical protein